MKSNNNNATENRDFNYGLTTTTETKHTEKLGDVVTWSREWKNDKGEQKSITVTDKMIVLALENVEKLLQLKEFSSLGVCLELSEIAKVKEKLGMRSIAEIGEKWFHLKASTATQYARVGKYFVIKNVSDKGTAYRFIDDIEIAGGGNATVTNLVQCLSLIDDKADDDRNQTIVRPCLHTKEIMRTEKDNHQLQHERCSSHDGNVEPDKQLQGLALAHTSHCDQKAKRHGADQRQHKNQYGL